MKIVTNEKLLRRPTDFVEDGEDISEIVDNLFLEMHNHDALGLAANQLGYDKRIFVMSMKPWPPICMVNAVIKKTRGSQVAMEMCKSLPGVQVSVKRPPANNAEGRQPVFQAGEVSAERLAGQDSLPRDRPSNWEADYRLQGERRG